MTSLIIPSFGRGEMAPALYARVDTAAYGVALRTARNIIIRAGGGASNRPGLTWIGPVKTHSYAPRLFEFQFKTSDTYLIELGDLYARFIRNDGHVLEAAKTITGITAANPPVVTSAAHGFSNGDEVFVTAVVGMTRVNGRRFIVGGATANTFTLIDQVTAVAIDGSAFAAYVSGGTAARVYTIASPYAKADLDTIKVAQSADTMTMTHPSYPVYELSRTAHTSWTFTAPTFAPSTTKPTGVAVGAGAGAVTRRYRVTALASDTLEESLPGLNSATQVITAITKANPAVVTSVAHGYSNGDEVELNAIVGMTDLNGRRFTAANVAANTFELSGENSTAYTAYASGGTSNLTFCRTTTSATSASDTITWTAVSGASRYSVYLEQNGIFGWLGDTESATFTNSNMAPNLTISPPAARNPFRTAGSFPGAPTFFQQRRTFGGSTNKPDTSEYSQTGSTSNFSKSTPGQDDDAITATLASRQVNEIRHYVPADDLLVFTSGSEWQVNSGSDSNFSASTLKQHPQSAWGVSHNAPIIIGKTILFVTENQASVRKMGFSWQVNGYTGSDVTVLASHIFEDYQLTDWAFARTPDPIVYSVRADGQAAAFTFNEEQQMEAWARWDTRGKFERVCSLRRQATERDEAAYFVVKRTINGNTVRYIERTHSRRFTDVRDCFFVDAGLSYNSPVTITGITAANPVVVTAVAHGFSNGDEVDIFDVTWISSFDDDGNETQPDQLNGRRYTVANATADTFQLSGVDGSANVAYVEGGTVRKAVLTVSGYDHLEGSPVAVLADGNVVTGLSVANGDITLPRKASRVHGGLGYYADLETLNIEAPGGGGTIQGKFKKISKVTVRFEKSRGLLIGPGSDQLTEMKQREFERMGDPTALLTGDKEVTIEPSWNTNGRLFLRQKYPLPMTILAVIPDLNLGG